MLISHGDKLELPVEEIAADEILTASGIFPLDEIPTEHLDIPDLLLESTARQTVRNTTRARIIPPAYRGSSTSSPDSLTSPGTSPASVRMTGTAGLSVMVGRSLRKITWWWARCSRSTCSRIMNLFSSTVTFHHTQSKS